MLEDTHWEGRAGDEVRKCERVVTKALNELEEAQAAVAIAREALDRAERDLDVAKRVYFAGEEDRKASVRAPRISAQKKEWIKALPRDSPFGATEMMNAAREIGWEPSDGALRVLSREYRIAGYFTIEGRGSVSLDRERIIEVLGDIFDDVQADEAGKTSADPDEVLGEEISDIKKNDPGISDHESPKANRRYRAGEEDFDCIDDDLPF